MLRSIFTLFTGYEFRYINEKQVLQIRTLKKIEIRICLLRKIRFWIRPCWQNSGLDPTPKQNSDSDPTSKEN